jgi:hypothetical protein
MRPKAEGGFDLRGAPHPLPQEKTGHRGESPPAGRNSFRRDPLLLQAQIRFAIHIVGAAFAAPHHAIEDGGSARKPKFISASVL